MRKVIFILMAVFIFTACTTEDVTNDVTSDLIELQKSVDSPNSLAKDLSEIQNRGTGGREICRTPVGSGWAFSSGNFGVWTPATGLVYYSSESAVQQWCNTHQQ